MKQELPTLEKLQATATAVYQHLLERLTDPWFWGQFGLLALVFVLARWLFGPRLARGLELLAQRATKLNGPRRLLRALRQQSTVIVWLLPRWVAIGVVARVGMPHRALTLVASLLSAWLIIRLASLLVKNQAVARTLTLLVWTAAAARVGRRWEVPASQAEPECVGSRDIHLVGN